MRIENIQFYELRKIRTKKFAKRLRTVFNSNKMEDELFEQKVKKIKLHSQVIDGKLKNVKT